MIELRELEPDDAESVQRIYGPESVRCLGRGPMELRDAQEFVADAVAAAKQSPRTLHTLGLVVDGDLLGVLKLHVDRPAAAISYILRPDSWGRGYATEGVHNILALAFGRLGLPEVHAKHHPDNPASGRVLLKAGFVPTGEHTDCHTYVVRPVRTVGGSLFEPALPTPRDTPMSDSSGPGTFDPDGKQWHAEYTFLGQAAVPGPDGLPGLRGIPDNIGWSAADDFERLAAQLIASAARQWRPLELDPSVYHFGEALLKHARRVAQDVGRWTYEPNTKQQWADVVVTFRAAGN
ncbi:GNAT family N-acetyltransferase [Kitasatospora sp. NPDC058032]|uniref:GNAT family N-acetyltransferase n=1 Tax=Kitasatospora sp. NPDC058032 TaxID=3346307 RepID=UPI0036D9611B